MALTVYRDEARTLKVEAKYAYKEDKKTRFYCANRDCEAHMYICSKDGSSSFYFKATLQKHRHMPGCDHTVSNNFDPSNFNESAFDFNKTIRALTEISKPQSKKTTPKTYLQGESNLKPPHTILQIYSLCKSYADSETYNEIVIGTMLLSERSNRMYRNPKDVIGWRIIEAKRDKPNYYDPIKREICIVSPTNNPKYKFRLKFNDDDLYKDMQNEIFHNKDCNIIVAGNWDYYEKDDVAAQNEFSTTIMSKKQYKIIKEKKEKKEKKETV